ncbi:MAG TPA: NrdH-redoxin [Cyanobacteria bacterium UBA8530]|nr:NrdH-redoxin [Cyanobacteria bacterium UBA8530]
MITVYSTDTCPYCTLAKRYLSDKGVVFNEVNVARDQQAAREMVKKTGQMGVPVLDIDGTVILGFDKPRIDAALKTA